MVLCMEFNWVMEECKRLQVENSNLVQKICSIFFLEMVVLVVVDFVVVVFVVLVESDVVVFGEEMDEVQGNVNGNVKVKEDKFVGERKFYCIGCVLGCRLVKFCLLQFLGFLRGSLLCLRFF